jgi:hypothetical protein
MATKIFTEAEDIAEKSAARWRKIGWNAKVEITEHEGYFYSDGSPMIPPTVNVCVYVRKDGLFEDSYGAQWSTRLPTPGFRTSTKYLGGHKMRAFSPNWRSRMVKLTQRQWFDRLHGEEDYERWKAQQA